MQYEIIIVGAGAAGLMAAKELSLAGKKVLILEARDRIGGRIYPLSENDFGYPAQGGAEYVHGSASVTKALLKEAGLTYQPAATDAEMWTVKDGKLEIRQNDPLEEQDFSKYHEELMVQVKKLQKDMPIRDFLDKYFADEKYSGMKAWIYRMVTGFDAADPGQISTFSLRDEWLSQEEWEQGRVKEGYTAALGYLYQACLKNSVEFKFNHLVEQVEQTKTGTKVVTDQGDFESLKVILTVSLPLIPKIQFNPSLPKKIEAAERIGFGSVIKFVLRFKESFWPEKMGFLFSNESVGTWWTQYPSNHPVLTGWLSGPKAWQYKNQTDIELLQLALASLAKIFQKDTDSLRKELRASAVVNWPADRWALGAYSYSKVGAEEAYEELRAPENNKIYFAGEACFEEKETATVEGALASGQFVAKQILNN